MKTLGWLLTLILVACIADAWMREDPFAYKQVEYEITNIKPPTNLQLTFRSVSTGLTYSNISISKTCGGWQRIKLGDRVWLTEASYRKGEEVEKRLADPAALIQILYCRI